MGYATNSITLFDESAANKAPRHAAPGAEPSPFPCPGPDAQENRLVTWFAPLAIGSIFSDTENNRHLFPNPTFRQATKAQCQSQSGIVDDGSGLRKTQ